MTRLWVLCFSLFNSTHPSWALVAPPFRGELLGGETVSLKDMLKPNRVIILSFWASWCVPCLEELKQLGDHKKKEPNLPLDLITINVDTAETTSDVKPTLKLYGFSFPVMLDPQHQVFSTYQSSKLLPFSALILSDGVIAKTFNGYHDAMWEQVKSVIATHLKAPRG